MVTGPKFEAFSNVAGNEWCNNNDNITILWTQSMCQKICVLGVYKC